jgi:hypothetical protein
MKIILQESNLNGFNFDVLHRRLNKANGNMKHTLTGGVKQPNPVNSPTKPVSGGPVKPVENPYKYLKTPGKFTGGEILDATIGGAVSVGKGLKTVGDTFSLTKAGKRKDLDTKVAFHEKKLAEAEQNYKTKGAELDGLHNALKDMNAAVSNTTSSIAEIEAQKKLLAEELKKPIDPTKQSELQKKIDELDKVKDEQQKLLEEQNAKITETNAEYSKVKAEFKKIGDLRDSSQSAFDSTSSKLASLLSQTKTKNQKVEQEGLLGLKQMIQKGQQGGKDNPHYLLAKELSKDTGSIPPNSREHKAFFLNQLKSAAPELVMRLTKDKNSKFNLYNMDAQQLHSAIKAVLYQDPKMIHEAFLNAVINASAQTVPMLVIPGEYYDRAINGFADIGDRMARSLFMTAEAEKSLSSSINEVKKTDTAKAIKQRMLAEKLNELKKKQADIDAQISKEQKDIEYYDQLKKRIPELEDELKNLSSAVTPASGTGPAAAAIATVSEEDLTKLTNLIYEEEKAKAEEAKPKKTTWATGALAGAPGVYVNVKASAKVVFPGTGYYMPGTKRFVSTAAFKKLPSKNKRAIINQGIQITEEDVGKEVPEPVKQTSEELIKDLITKLPDYDKRTKLLELTDELKAYRARGVDPESASALSNANIAKLEASKKALQDTATQFGKMETDLGNIQEAKDTMALIKDKFTEGAKTEDINKTQTTELARIGKELETSTKALDTIDSDIKGKSEELAKLDDRLPGYDTKKATLESELEILNAKREIEEFKKSQAEQELENTKHAFERLEEMAVYTAAVDKALDVDMPNRKPEERADVRKKALAMIGIATDDSDGKLSPLSPEKTLMDNIEGLVKSSGGGTIEFKPSFLLKAERELKQESRNAKQQRVETVSELKSTMASIGLDYKDAKGIPASYQLYKRKLGRFGKPVPELVFNAAKEKAIDLETKIKGFKAENNAARSKESESKIEDIKKRAGELKITLPANLNLSDASAVNAAYYSKKKDLAGESDQVKKKQLQDEIDLLDELVRAIPGKSANRARNIKAKGKTDVKENNKTLSNLNREIGLLNIVDEGITGKSGLKAISQVGKELTQVNKAITDAKWYKFGAGASTMTDDEVDTIKGLLAKKARLGETLEQLHSRVLGGYTDKGGIERKSKKLRTAALSDMKTKQARLDTLYALMTLETDAKVKESLQAEILEAGEKVAKVPEEYKTYNVTNDNLAKIQKQSTESAVVKRLERSLKRALNKPVIDTEARTKLFTDRAKAQDELAKIQELKANTDDEKTKVIDELTKEQSNTVNQNREKALESIISSELAEKINSNVPNLEIISAISDKIGGARDKVNNSGRTEVQNEVNKAKEELQQALVDFAVYKETIRPILSSNVTSTEENMEKTKTKEQEVADSIQTIINENKTYGIKPITTADAAIKLKYEQYTQAQTIIEKQFNEKKKRSQQKLYEQYSKNIDQFSPLNEYFKSQTELEKKKVELGATNEPNTQLAKLASDAEYLAAKESQLNKQITAADTELAKQSKLANAQRLLNQTRALAKGNEFTTGRRGIFGIGKREPLTAEKAKEGGTLPTAQGKTRLGRYQRQVNQLIGQTKISTDLTNAISTEFKNLETKLPEDIQSKVISAVSKVNSLEKAREAVEELNTIYKDRLAKGVDPEADDAKSLKTVIDKFTEQVGELPQKKPIHEQIAAETKTAKTEFETTLESAAKISQLDTEIADLKAKQAAAPEADKEEIQKSINKKTDAQAKAKQKVEDYNNKQKSKPAAGGGGGIFSLIGSESTDDSIQTQLLGKLDAGETAAKYGAMLKDVKGEMSALDDKLAKAGSEPERAVILARKQELRTQFNAIAARARKVTEIEGVNRRRDMTSEQADIKRRAAKMKVRGYAANVQRQATGLHTSTTPPTKPGENVTKKAISGRSPLGYFSRKRNSKLLERPLGSIDRSVTREAESISNNLKAVTNKLGTISNPESAEYKYLSGRATQLSKQFKMANSLGVQVQKTDTISTPTGKKARRRKIARAKVDGDILAIAIDTGVKTAIANAIRKQLETVPQAAFENPLYESTPRQSGISLINSTPNIVKESTTSTTRAFENPMYSTPKTGANNIYEPDAEYGYLDVAPEPETAPQIKTQPKSISRLDKNNPLLKPGNYTSEKTAIESIQSRVSGLAELSTKISKSGDQVDKSGTGLLTAGKAVLQAELDAYLPKNSDALTPLQKTTLAKQLDLLGLDKSKIGAIYANSTDSVLSATVKELTNAINEEIKDKTYGDGSYEVKPVLEQTVQNITKFTKQVSKSDQRVYLANLKPEELGRLKETLKQEADPAHAKLAKLALTHGDYLGYRIDSVVNRLDQETSKQPSAKELKSILSNKETWDQLVNEQDTTKTEVAESKTDTDKPIAYTGKPKLDRILKSISQRPAGEFSDREIGKLLEKAEAPAGTLELIKLQRALTGFTISGKINNSTINPIDPKYNNKLSATLSTLDTIANSENNKKHPAADVLVNQVAANEKLKSLLVGKTLNPKLIELLSQDDSVKAAITQIDENIDNLVKLQTGKGQMNLLRKRRIAKAKAQMADYIINNASNLQNQTPDLINIAAKYLPIDNKGLEAIYKLRTQEINFPVIQTKTKAKQLGLELEFESGIQSEIQSYIKDENTNIISAFLSKNEQGNTKLSKKELTKIADFLLAKQKVNFKKLQIPNEKSVNHVLFDTDIIAKQKAVKTSRDIKFLKKVLPPDEVINTRLTAIQDDYNNFYKPGKPENTSGMGIRNRTVKAIGSVFNRATKKMIRVGDRMFGLSPGQEMVRLLKEVQKPENAELKEALKGKQAGDFPEDTLQALAKWIDTKDIGLISVMAPEAQAEVIKRKIGDKPLAELSGLGLGGPLNTGVVKVYENYSMLYKDLPTEDQKNAVLNSITETKNLAHKAVITELVKGKITAEQVSELYDLAVQYKEATGSSIFKGKAAELKQQIETLIYENTSDKTLKVEGSDNIYDILPVPNSAMQSVLKLAGLEEKDGITVPDITITMEILNSNPKLVAKLVAAGSKDPNAKDKFSNILSEDAKVRLTTDNPTNVNLLANLGISDTEIISRVVENAKPDTAGLTEKARNEIFDNLAKHLATKLSTGNTDITNITLPNFNADKPAESIREYAELAKAMLRQENGAANLVKLMQNTELTAPTGESLYGDGPYFVNALVIDMYSDMSDSKPINKVVFTRAELKKVLESSPNIGKGRAAFDQTIVSGFVREFAGELPVQTLIDKVGPKEVVIEGLLESYSKEKQDAKTKESITKSVTDYLKGKGTDGPTEEIVITLEQASKLAGVLDSEEGFDGLIEAVKASAPTQFDPQTYLSKTITVTMDEAIIRENINALNNSLAYTHNPLYEASSVQVPILPNPLYEASSVQVPILPNPLYEAAGSKPVNYGVYDVVRAPLDDSIFAKIASAINLKDKDSMPSNLLNAIDPNVRQGIVINVVKAALTKSSSTTNLTDNEIDNLQKLSNVITTNKDAATMRNLNSRIDDAKTQQDKAVLQLLTGRINTQQFKDLNTGLNTLVDAKSDPVAKLKAALLINQLDSKNGQTANSRAENIYSTANAVPIKGLYDVPAGNSSKLYETINNARTMQSANTIKSSSESRLLTTENLDAVNKAFAPTEITKNTEQILTGLTVKELGLLTQTVTKESTGTDKESTTIKLLQNQVFANGLFSVGKEKLDAIGLTPGGVAEQLNTSGKFSDSTYLKSLTDYLHSLKDIEESAFKTNISKNPDIVNDLISAIDNNTKIKGEYKTDVLKHIADPERVASARVLNMARNATSSGTDIGEDPKLVNRMYETLESKDIGRGKVSLTGSVSVNGKYEDNAKSAILQLASGLTQDRVATLAERLDPSDLGNVLLAKLALGTKQVNDADIDVVLSAVKYAAKNAQGIPKVDRPNNPVAKYILDTLVDSTENRDYTADVIKQVLPRLQAIKDSTADKNKLFMDLLGELIGYDERDNIIMGLAEAMGLQVTAVPLASNPLYESQNADPSPQRRVNPLYSPAPNSPAPSREAMYNTPNKGPANGEYSELGPGTEYADARTPSGYEEPEQLRLMPKAPGRGEYTKILQLPQMPLPETNETGGYVDINSKPVANEEGLYNIAVNLTNREPRVPVTNLIGQKNNPPPKPTLPTEPEPNAYNPDKYVNFEAIQREMKAKEGNRETETLNSALSSPTTTGTQNSQSVSTTAANTASKDTAQPSGIRPELSKMNPQSSVPESNESLFQSAAPAVPKTEKPVLNPNPNTSTIEQIYSDPNSLNPFNPNRPEPEPIEGLENLYKEVKMEVLAKEAKKQAEELKTTRDKFAELIRTDISAITNITDLNKLISDIKLAQKTYNNTVTKLSSVNSTGTNNAAIRNFTPNKLIEIENRIAELKKLQPSANNPIAVIQPQQTPVPNVNSKAQKQQSQQAIIDNMGKQLAEVEAKRAKAAQEAQAKAAQEALAKAEQEAQAKAAQEQAKAELEAQAKAAQEQAKAEQEEQAKATQLTNLKISAPKDISKAVKTALSKPNNNHIVDILLDAVKLYPNKFVEPTKAEPKPEPTAPPKPEKPKAKAESKQAAANEKNRIASRPLHEKMVDELLKQIKNKKQHRITGIIKANIKYRKLDANTINKLRMYGLADEPTNSSSSTPLTGGYLSPAIIRGRRQRGTKRLLDPLTHVHPRGSASKKEYQVRPGRGTKRQAIRRPKYQTQTRKLLL